MPGICYCAVQGDGSVSRAKEIADQPTVFVIDDDDGLREGLISLFRSIRLTAKGFGSVEEFQRHRPLSRPGCLVLDVRLPGLSGLDLQTALKQFDDPMPSFSFPGMPTCRCQ